MATEKLPKIKFQIEWYESERIFLERDFVEFTHLDMAIDEACRRMKNRKCPAHANGFIVGKRG